MPNDTQQQPPAVIVVAYHNTDDLRRCLTALGRWADLVVVDNGAEDEVERLVAMTGGRYLRPASNVGFAAAVNMGLRLRAPGQHALLLNPDAVLGRREGEALMERLELVSGCAAVAPRLEEPDGRAQRTEWPLPSPREAWVDALGLRRWIRPRRCFLSGAALLLNGRALDEVGEFDERFFLYAEESDWQLRAQRAGWTVMTVDDVRVVHAGGRSSASSERREVLFHRSGEAFGRKWYGPRGWAVMRAASVVGAARRLLLAAGRPERAHHAFLLRLYLRGAGQP